MNTNLKKILCIVLAVVLVLLLFLFIQRSKPADTPEEPEVTAEDNTATEDTAGDEDNDIYFEEENDGAEIEIREAAPDEFIGSWKATSAQALYQYGMVNINIEAGGTWNGYIAHEDLKGTWEETEDGIYLTSDIFECDLKFTKDDLLVMFYSPNNDDYYLTTVLTEK